MIAGKMERNCRWDRSKLGSVLVDVVLAVERRELKSRQDSKASSSRAHTADFDETEPAAPRNQRY